MSVTLVFNRETEVKKVTKAIKVRQVCLAYRDYLVVMGFPDHLETEDYQ